MAREVGYTHFTQDCVSHNIDCCIYIDNNGVTSNRQDGRRTWPFLHLQEIVGCKVNNLGYNIDCVFGLIEMVIIIQV